MKKNSATKAVRARWAKAGKPDSAPPVVPAPDNSDQTLTRLLKRLRNATDLAEFALLSERIERVVFHKQF